jgi:hypothetical protein
VSVAVTVSTYVPALSEVEVEMVAVFAPVLVMVIPEMNGVKARVFVPVPCVAVTVSVIATPDVPVGVVDPTATIILGFTVTVIVKVFVAVTESVAVTTMETDLLVVELVACTLESKATV